MTAFVGTVVTGLSALGALITVFLGMRRGWRWFDERFPDEEAVREEVAEELSDELFVDLFGEDVSVERVDGEYGARIAAAAADAEEIRRLSGNTKRIDGMDDFDQFVDPTVHTRLLVIDPARRSDAQTGAYTGFEMEEAIGRERDADLSFIRGRYGGLREYLKSDGDWENAKARTYVTTPWIRMVLFKGDEEAGWREAGFTFSPTLADFNEETPKFWTEDPMAIKALRSIYEDVWHDPRTEPYLDTYARVFGDDAPAPIDS
ncbi:hypothetical protein [Halorussus salinisoli]|uniref:hypothetical protein n=1 Tax=Halorussus salinisoli TaxID=2558242 RepID=UPI0010C1E1DA|nr:hypothetical protein [Halorussus salinisoli]